MCDGVWRGFLWFVWRSSPTLEVEKQRRPAAGEERKVLGFFFFYLVEKMVGRQTLLGYTRPPAGQEAHQEQVVCV